jgi:hypothetical protein
MRAKRLSEFRDWLPEQLRLRFGAAELVTSASGSREPKPNHDGRPVMPWVTIMVISRIILP